MVALNFFDSGYPKSIIICDNQKMISKKIAYFFYPPSITLKYFLAFIRVKESLTLRK